MAKIISVSMNKGGVGKTSLITNLAAAITSNNPKAKVLIIDTDGQGNSAIAFGKNPQEFENNIYHVFIGDAQIQDVRIELTDTLHIVPANDDMNFLEFDILSNTSKYNQPFTLLKQAIQPIKDQYDYIFIDTPPSMGLVAGNVLAVADDVIIPFVPEMFAVQGLIRVIEAVEDFKQKTNPDLKITGIVGMMVDTRTTLHSEMIQKARKYCTGKNLKMFETIIPRSIRFANATAYEGKPAVWTDKSNSIVAAYFELLGEVLEGVQK